MSTAHPPWSHCSAVCTQSPPCVQRSCSWSFQTCRLRRGRLLLTRRRSLLLSLSQFFFLTWELCDGDLERTNVSGCAAESRCLTLTVRRGSSEHTRSRTVSEEETRAADSSTRWKGKNTHQPPRWGGGRSAPPSSSPPPPHMLTRSCSSSFHSESWSVTAWWRGHDPPTHSGYINITWSQVTECPQEALNTCSYWFRDNARDILYN